MTTVRIDGANECTAWMLTPPGRAAVATVCLSGPVVRELLDLFFEPQSQGLWSSQSLNRLFYGNWLGPDGSREDLVICRKTSVAFEIYCHGGTLPTRRILGNLQDQGCRIGSPWEAMRTETRDLISAEARWLLSSQGSQVPASILARQAMGALSNTVDQIEQLIWEGTLHEAKRLALQLLDTWSWGMRISRPPRVAFCGRPNVGKSSLINAILGYERSIVVDRPGTTRDLVMERAVIGGWPVELIDTAGLRSSTSDPLEAQGIGRAQHILKEVDGIVAVSSFPDCPAVKLPDEIQTPVLQVLNKSDLCSEVRPACDVLMTSVLENQGILDLLSQLQAMLIPRGTPPDAIIFTDRQKQHLETAISALSKSDGRTALQGLTDLKHQDEAAAPSLSN
ncbi:MAG: GTPase [Planctomycetota bacterium]|nr:GTPase [Planctomycetota bacterium]